MAKDDRIVTLGAHQEESAVLVLRAMLAEAPAGETIEINWLSSAQQWAIREVVAAGIELQPFGPVMVRGMDGPRVRTSRAGASDSRTRARFTRFSGIIRQAPTAVQNTIQADDHQ